LLNNFRIAVFTAICTVAAVILPVGVAHASAAQSDAERLKHVKIHVDYKPEKTKDRNTASIMGNTNYIHLDRIDQIDLPLDGNYSPAVGYGQGVTIYEIDSGIRITHQEFGGRASYGWDFIDNDATAQDCYGHGTHVAGLAAGATVGAAKFANIVAVRVFDCYGNGTGYGFVQALDWVRTHAHKPAVVNLSGLVIGGDTSVDAAVNNLLASGVQITVAAGNNNANACNSSPGRVSGALTLGNSSASDDLRYNSSNYGSCVDLYAPGVNDWSSCYLSDTQLCTMTGTSMSAPLAAGVIALYLGVFPNKTPAELHSWMVTKAKPKIINSPAGTTNKLLYIGPTA